MEFIPISIFTRVFSEITITYRAPFVALSQWFKNFRWDPTIYFAINIPGSRGGKATWIEKYDTNVRHEKKNSNNKEPPLGTL